MNKLGPRPNELGSNELRADEANRTGNRWSINILPNELTPEQKEEIDELTPWLNEMNGGRRDEDDAHYAGWYAAVKVLEQ